MLALIQVNVPGTHPFSVLFSSRDTGLSTLCRITNSSADFKHHGAANKTPALPSHHVHFIHRPIFVYTKYTFCTNGLSIASEYVSYNNNLNHTHNIHDIDGF